MQKKQLDGKDFDMSKFHKEALEAGAIPVPVLARLMTGQALGTQYK